MLYKPQRLKPLPKFSQIPGRYFRPPMPGNESTFSPNRPGSPQNSRSSFALSSGPLLPRQGFFFSTSSERMYSPYFLLVLQLSAIGADSWYWDGLSPKCLQMIPWFSRGFSYHRIRTSVQSPLFCPIAVSNPVFAITLFSCRQVFSEPVRIG